MNLKTRTAVADRIERIRLRNGGLLTPNDVVTDAEDKSSPLHSFFTWDDEKAAKERRLDQARDLIRSVRYELIIDTLRIEAPCYVRDPRVSSDEQGYGAVAEFRNDEDVAKAAVRYELQHAEGSVSRAINIAEALGMADRIAGLLVQLRAIRVALDTPSEKSAAKRTAKKGPPPPPSKT